MGKKNKFIGIRVSEEEYNRLKELAIDTPEGRNRNGTLNLAGYIRSRVFAAAGIKNTSLISNVKDLNYEIRKLGVNVNQIARKMNSGIGTERDIEVLRIKLERIEQLIAYYTNEVNQIWQSPN